MPRTLSLRCGVLTHALRRRERKQLTRTTADMFRLVPLLVIVVRTRARKRVMSGCSLTRLRPRLIIHLLHN